MGYLYGMTEPGFHSKQEIKGEVYQTQNGEAPRRRASFFASAPLVLLAVLAAAVYLVARLSGE